MSRICVVGMGTPDFVPCRRHHGPGKRASHFAHALIAAGHEVLVVAVDCVDVPAGARFPVASGEVSVMSVAWADFADGRVDREVERFGASAIVAATAHAGALASQLDSELPLWVDVFGDLMAEAQAKAVAHETDAAIGSFWGALVPALRRGDRFSAVSKAQADSLYGQLGITGRLNGATAEQRLVSVIPCAAAVPEALAAPAWNRSLTGLELPADAFVVLWSGSFNTWCDIGTTLDAMERAMDECPNVHFVATGAGVPGHDERTYARFDRRVRASRHRGRYHLSGWVDESALAGIYASADVGLVVERDLLERRYGSENRVAEWLAHGLPCVTTAHSELGRDLSDRGLAFSVPPSDAGALSETIVRLAGTGVEAALRDRCRAYAARSCGYEQTAAELVEWCAAPAAAADRGRVPITVGLVSEPTTMVKLLEAYVAELSPGELAYRSIRWVWRRLAARVRGRHRAIARRRVPAG
jgi:glycosyltransferase involved in cell wall biosynthesis